jgi:predicted CXXCH cytochrome family protein
MFIRSGTLLLLLIVGCASHLNGHEGQLPEIKKDCTICHLSQDGRPGGILKKPLSGLCLECHPARKVPNEHKVDISPAMTVTDLPLAEGKMTCVTCHDPHSATFPNMLRTAPKELCFRCHKY